MKFLWINREFKYIAEDLYGISKKKKDDNGEMK